MVSLDFDIKGPCLEQETIGEALLSCIDQLKAQVPDLESQDNLSFWEDIVLEHME